MDIKLPSSPEPIEIEIELTNNCNAACVACPRHELDAPRGFLTDEVFYAIVEKYDAYRNKLAINQIEQKVEYPFLSFAGMGEPLLHPKIFEYMKYATDRKFNVILYSNASLLTKEKAHQLVEAGVKHINFSFWGTHPEEYHQGMGLDFHTSLQNIEYMAKLAKENNISIIVSFIKSKWLKSSTKDIVDFWTERGIEVDIEDDNKAWNRGGLLSDEMFHENFEEYPTIDFSLPIWCSQLFFTDTICWNGDVLVCSCDYYKKTEIVGNILTDSPEDIMKRKYEILVAKQKPDICMKCRKPDRNYALGSTPWDEILDEEEKKKYYYSEGDRK